MKMHRLRGIPAGQSRPKRIAAKESGESVAIA